MGSRVRNVMSELHGEKIDIVDYSDDPADFVASALSPARVNRVNVIDLAAREAQVIVPDYQLSLAIGKEGQNARLAARLTGWRIDIRSDAAPAPSDAAPAPSDAAPAPSDAHPSESQPSRPRSSESQPSRAQPSRAQHSRSQPSGSRRAVSEAPVSSQAPPAPLSTSNPAKHQQSR
jgi:N utilization substance protein A